MQTKWVFEQHRDKEKTASLSNTLKISDFLAQILVQRGYDSFDKAKYFFRPSLSDLHDPFLMKGMTEAVNKLSESIFNKDKILIYGDYDVDGTTSVALFILFLKQFDLSLDFYIPDRYTEGYGISERGIEYADSQHCKMIIALDCGIQDVEPAKQAKEKGIDLIICDHHLPGKTLPDAIILDPKQEKCTYPFKGLSGCGVGFKLLEGYCIQNSIPQKNLFQYLDLVTVSIASDIVPMVDENRILAYFGLKKLNENPSNGLKELVTLSKKKSTLHITDIVFFIGPRINAAGRLAHARESVNLLTKENEDLSQANLLTKYNTKRREFDQSITKEAIEMLQMTPSTNKSTVLFDPNWHKGVIGIVASRCIEYRHRPTIILTAIDDSFATGSARSVEGFNIVEAIGACEPLLTKFGGHFMAAGLTLPIKNITAFKKQFEEEVSNTINSEHLTPKLKIDAEILLEDIHYKTYNIIRQMEPFGPENLSPVFVTHHLYLKKHIVLKGKHLKGWVTDKKREITQEFIAFGQGEKIASFLPQTTLSLAYHIELNEFQGHKTIVLNVKDIRFDI